MTTFIIVRHGLSVTNGVKIFTGQRDVDLADIGYIQAEKTGKYIKENYKIDKIYSSDLMRTLKTAAPAASALGLPVHKMKELREISVGSWQGRFTSDIEAEDPENYRMWKEDISSFRFPEGENLCDVAKRAKKAFDEIAKENEGKTVLV